MNFRMDKKYCIAAMLLFVTCASGAFCEKMGVDEVIVASVVESDEGDDLDSVKNEDLHGANKKMNRRGNKKQTVNKRGTFIKKIQEKPQSSLGKAVSLFRTSNKKEPSKRKKNNEVVINRGVGRVGGSMCGSYCNDDVKDVYNPNKFFNMQNSQGRRPVDVLGRSEESVKNVARIPGIPGARPEHGKILIEEKFR
jgi:hypothetical protein